MELDSTDYLDRGALLLAPVNPARYGGPSSFRFRAARLTRATASPPGMARRALERLDDEGLSGRVRVLRVLSDTNPVSTAGAGLAGGRTLGVSEPEPQVSWKALEQDATVVTSDGDESARVVEIVGDPAADIFNGLVLNLGVLDKNRHLPAERVPAIWPKRVEVDATAGRAEVPAALRGARRSRPSSRPAASSRVCGTCSAELGGAAPRKRELERDEREDGQLAQQQLRGGAGCARPRP